MLFLGAVSFISLGAILGSSLRWFIINRFTSIFNENFIGILTVNNISTFLLGFLLGLFNRYQMNLDSNSFFLFAVIGFLGSLSTFSSFIMELLQFFIDKQWKKFFLFSTLSISAGIFVAFIGYELSNF